MKFSPKYFILINTNITTLDPSFPKATWVAIENDKFFKIGYGDDWKDLNTKSSHIIDGSGKTVLPGLIDAHLHVVSYAKSLVTLNLGPNKNVFSVSDIQSIIQRYSRNRPPGTWIFGKGYHEFYLGAKRHPNRWDLDKAAPDHPIQLTHRSGHAHVLNSLALKHVGIGKETGDPAGGMIERDLKTGEPTGLLYEMGNFLSDRIPPLKPAELERGLQMANHEFLASGITSIHDASPRNDSKRCNLFKSWKAQGFLQPRVNMMLAYQTFSKNGYQHLSANVDKNQLRPGAVKIILDDTTGQLHPPQKDLNEMVLEIHKAGMQVAIHAIEEESIEAACSAIKYALDRVPRKDHRHRLEHCSVCPPSLAGQIASLGIMVVTHPPFIYYNGERYLETVPERQLDHLYPFRTLLHHGVNLVGSSDCPIVPPNPLIGIYAAVSRMGEKNHILGRNEKISAIDVLRMYTKNAAQASFEETIKGTITPGKLADLVVLNGDPTQLPTDELKRLQVEMTMIGGDVVWKRES
ncbi:MAG: amidohydrolase [Deltaproteobacteria bacterium]|nr:MAG: amidohydrolase [Deltaproteobacteria bacterium]